MQNGVGVGHFEHPTTHATLRDLNGDVEHGFADWEPSIGFDALTDTWQFRIVLRSDRGIDRMELNIFMTGTGDFRPFISSPAPSVLAGVQRDAEVQNRGWIKSAIFGDATPATTTTGHHSIRERAGVAVQTSATL